MRRLIFAAFFATAIVFPGSTYSSEKEFKVPNSDCLISSHHKQTNNVSFCDTDRPRCCCENWAERDMPVSESRKRNNGVSCTDRRMFKVRSGDTKTHGPGMTMTWICEDNY